MGAHGGVPDAASYASSLPAPVGAAICEASRGERKSMPWGIWCAQKSIGSPKIRTAIPRAFRWAAADSPYGPAPIIVTSHAVIDSLTAWSRSKAHNIHLHEPIRPCSPHLQLHRARQGAFSSLQRTGHSPVLQKVSLA